jgi:glycosyltransferase involved in cell wall biosynthesis
MKVGLFFGSFAGGGAERMMVNLARGMVLKGMDVTIYVVNKTGPYLKEVPQNIPIKSYDARFGVKSVIYKIRKTLKEDELSAFISTQMHINAAVGLASIGLKNKPKIIFREANTPSEIISSHLSRVVYRWTYKYADHYVAVSQGVKDDMIPYLSLEKEDVTVIYNPVIDETILEKMQETVEHPWFNDSNVPIIVGMGRFAPQKKFEDLIDAFTIVRKSTNARLVIFGEKNETSSYFRMIQDKINDSGYSEDIWLPGFVNNPFKFLKKANVFVLSSKFEGLPGVLIQAMACGCPVVSTDCPSGPKEILKNGEFGKLVEVGNYEKLAKAIIDTLKDPNNTKDIKKRGQYFTIKNATKNYLEMIVAL